MVIKTLAFCLMHSEAMQKNQCPSTTAVPTEHLLFLAVKMDGDTKQSFTTKPKSVW